MRREQEGMEDSMLRRIQWITPDERDELREEAMYLNTIACGLSAVIVTGVLIVIYFYFSCIYHALGIY